MDSIFSASEPNLGYLYQIRYGLLLIVSASASDAELLIETIDDVSIDTAGIIDLYQTKLHISSVANLTNASPDLWKTIRVWSEKIKTGEINPNEAIFNLVTTANASTGTIPYQLKQDTHIGRDLPTIQASLLSVATSSASTTNSPAYLAFQSLTNDQQLALIKNIIVTDASIDINEARTKILHELRHSTLKVEALYERLEGWFLGQVIYQLQGHRGAISAKEVNDKIIDLADCLKADNLPNDFNLPITSDDTQLAPYRNQVFVKQMELIGANPKMVNNAISDYHRAFSQKSKWIRDGLIHPHDEIEYDGKLKEDWERKFAIISDSPSSDDVDVQKTKGHTFYVTHYVQVFPQIHIKERFKEQYMVTGCCQMLSDKKRIGWHPNYENSI